MIEPLVMADPGTNLTDGRDMPSGDALREVLRRFAAGVTVVTTRNGAVPAGMTATAFSSVSLEPPVVLVCLNASSQTAGAVAASGIFAINILASSQRDIADRFSQRSDDKFAGVSWSNGPESLPYIDAALGVVACRVRSITEAGTHRIVLGDVIDCQHRDADALIYLDGRYVTTTEL